MAPHVSADSAGLRFPYSSIFARWVQLCTRARAYGHRFTPISTPTRSGARGVFLSVALG